MKYGRWFLAVSAAWLVAACSSSSGSSGGDEASDGILAADSAGFVGIYQTTNFTENTAGCDAPGASSLSGLEDKFFLAASFDELSVGVLMLVSCNSVSDCQSKRTLVTSLGFYSSLYSFTLSSKTNATTLSGFEATTGFGEGTMCTGRTYAEHTLTLNADHSLHLESRTKDLADRSQQGGFCEVEPAQAKQEAASLPCSDLKTLDGTFVQAM